jgi:pyruvate dehydrogenase E2 component (dihydrolipoamide acetyltransferase)
VTNLGGYGSVDYFTPIINPPQAAILGIGRIRETVTPVNGEPGIRPMIALSLTYDHRIIDGAVAAEFMKILTGFIDRPFRALIGE